NEDLNRGIALRLLCRTHEAISYYEHALPAHPSAMAHGHYALALLTAGRFRDGWDQYEFRWLEGPLKSQRARCDRPAWSGQDLRGKTILLRCEQGAGDVFQFVRYAPLVKARGATVLLELRPGLGVLADVFPGIDRAIRPGEASPDFDFYADLMSLPRVFGTTLSSIPVDIPYLHAPAHVRMPWRDRLAGVPGMKVGLVWAGDPKHARDRQRSIPLAMLSSLIEVEGTRWFSLQKGSAAAAAKAAPFEGVVVDLAPELYEYVDTAAAIENLDLVVTVDTSVAHLAGALGKPVWVLLPHCADWRWMEEREVSPWYPTMRLFRQPAPDQWQDVVERLRSTLIALVAGTADEPTIDATPLTDIRDSDVAGAQAAGGDASPQAHLSRACRTRYGMMQYLPSRQPLARSIEHYGEYLQAQSDVLRRLVIPGAVVAVIDAGIGLDAIVLAPVVGSQGQVFAIERSTVLRRILRQNLAANDVTSVSVMTESHAAATLDELQLERLDLLKVTDPAGIARVLDGAERTLWRHRPALFLAQPSQAALDAQLLRLRDFGYRCWRVASPLFNPANFNRRDDDIFPGQVALALLALPEETELDADVRGMAGVSAASGTGA
ncbi:MAG TPA: glycosyltransferase family 9 protein, partial [Casimicrobiaceae bacterium]|nr:glycosyltransferase family 9 protein [Casimicrobiaceae bacterium]